MLRGRLQSVNGQFGRRLLLALLMGALSAGCSTFTYYPQGMEHTTLSRLRTGQKPNYAKILAPRLTGKDRILFALEMGRVAQLLGDLPASRTAFDKTIAAVQEQEDKAVISASGAAAQSGAVLVNDKAIPYRPPDYEQILMHHYQALNYLATNDLAGAAVEIRRANRRQEQARERREREIEALREAGRGTGGAGDPHLARVYAGLNEVAGSVKYSFQNAATFYLSAVVWEMLGERNDAYIDYKKALEIYPDHPALPGDVIRLGKRLGMREDVEAFQQRFPEAAETPPDGDKSLKAKARLVIFYEEGLVPPKTEVSVAYPLPSANAIGVIALPTYAAAPPAPVPAVVNINEEALGITAPICNVSALAARALADQLPGILTRQVARAVAKAVAAKVAKDAAGGWGELLATLYNSASEQADLRSWLTLPAHIQLFSGWADAGEAIVALTGPAGVPFWSQPVTLSAGKTTLLYVTRMDSAVYSLKIVQP